MVDNPKPYYIILILILIFIFLWYFFGENEQEFIGIKPLHPDNDIIIEKRIDIMGNVEKNGTPPLCIDITPALPPQFTSQVCFNTTNNNKFLSKGEKICKETMERIYGVPFPNTRPSWLKNDLTGRCLEIDCYNADLKIGVDYCGIQHYCYPNFLNMSYDDFQAQVRRDELKKELCKQYGVYLIVVPYNVEHHLIPSFIMQNLPEVVQERIKSEQILD